MRHYSAAVGGRSKGGAHAGESRKRKNFRVAWGPAYEKRGISPVHRAFGPAPQGKDYMPASAGNVDGLAPSGPLACGVASPPVFRAPHATQFGRAFAVRRQALRSHLSRLPLAAPSSARIFEAGLAYRGRRAPAVGSATPTQSEGSQAFSVRGRPRNRRFRAAKAKRFRSTRARSFYRR
jgi:hypothetical protein